MKFAMTAKNNNPKIKLYQVKSSKLAIETNNNKTIKKKDKLANLSRYFTQVMSWNFCQVVNSKINTDIIT